MTTTESDYRERLDYLYGRLNYERLGMPRSSTELKIGRMRRLLRSLGDPQDGARIVHVAGTKGKGSTAVMIAAALSASGRRTGLFTSPHLIRLEERFRVDGEQIGATDLVGLIDRIRPVVEKLDATDPHFAEREATFFEITTAIGLLHFAEVETDAVVLEVGLGGRLDSTNAVHPVVSVITTISFDHTKLLGNTLEQIATEKAGILKRNRPVVIGSLCQEASDAIQRIARSRRCPVHEFNSDFFCDYTPPSPPLERPSSGQFHTRTWRTDWGRMDVPLLGSHQATNASVALATLDVLAESGIEVTPQQATQGFSKVSWPARLEVMGEHPWLVIDGAHNVASAEALAESLLVNFPKVPRTLVFGTTKDKDLPGQLQRLLPHFDAVVATRYIENPRSVPVDELAEWIRRLSPLEPYLAQTPAEALQTARNLTASRGLICVTGSLFLTGEIRALLLQEQGTNRLLPSQ